MKKPNFFVGLLLPAFFCIISSYTSCAMPTISRFAEDVVEEDIPREALKITKTTETLSLAWNIDNTENLKSYKVYYRARGDTEWILLQTINPPVPLYEIEKNNPIGSGTWEFGIRTVDLSDVESEIHTCLDPNAEPASGWYLSWEN